MGFIFLIPLKSVFAENFLIVEVQIAGEKDNNDFIKIYNPSNEDLNIAGYKLRKRSSTGSKSSIRVFPQDSKIPAKGYFLWANSKDNFHLTVSADVCSTATLAKNNSIALLNPAGIIIDALAWGESQNPFVEEVPFPENPGHNQKLERKKIAGVYQDTNNNANDFYLNPPSKPKTEAPLQESETQPEPQPESDLELLEEPKTIIYPSGIVINEILPNTPVGIRDEEGEYIEIFNQNDFEVDLTGWQIEDTAGRTTTYTFPQGTKILAQGFLVLYRPTSKITLNNDGDGLNLFQPDGKIINTVNYEKAPRGQSYNRTDSKWVWSTILTPGRPNEIPVLKTEEAEFVEGVGKIDINTAPLEDLVKIVHIGEARAQELISLRPFYSLDDLTRIKGIGAKALEDIKKQGLAWVDPTLKPPKIEKETEPIEKGLAAVGEPFKPFEKQIPKSLSVFLIALALAIFSGIIILILKRKLKSLPI